MTGDMRFVQSGADPGAKHELQDALQSESMPALKQEIMNLRIEIMDMEDIQESYQQVLKAERAIYYQALDRSVDSVKKLVATQEQLSKQLQQVVEQLRKASVSDATRMHLADQLVEVQVGTQNKAKE